MLTVYITLLVLVIIVVFGIFWFLYKIKNRINTLETNYNKTQKMMRQIDDKDAEYFIKLLSQKLIEQCQAVSIKNKLPLKPLVTKIVDKFQDLNVALKNKKDGQQLVHHLQQYNQELDVDPKENETKITDDDIEEIINDQENLIYIIYPKLMK